MLFVIFSKDCSEVITLYYSARTFFAYAKTHYINFRTYDFHVNLLFNTFDIQFETSENPTRHVVRACSWRGVSLGTSNQQNLFEIQNLSDWIPAKSMRG